MAAQWELALEQSKNLGVTHGSICATAEAVRQGAHLRLFLIARGYEETLYFQQTYAGEGDAFAGLMTHHHSYAHRGSLAEQPYFSFFKYDTSGTFSQVKWMLDNRTFDESQPYPYGVYRWYVCDRWRVVYEHDADGNRLSGDLETLKEHIRAGYSIESAFASCSASRMTIKADRSTSHFSISCNRLSKTATSEPTAISSFPAHRSGRLVGETD